MESHWENRSCQECGKTFSARTSPSRAGRGKYCSRACGARFRQRRHGHSWKTGQSPTYGVWATMVGRCRTPTNVAYVHYGAKGITVCDRWRKDFANFLADMGVRPDGLTLDRIDGAKGYSPDNCRWATRMEQSHNLKNNVNITHDGRTQCLSEWSRELGIHPATLTFRLRKGWSVSDAFTVAPKFGNRVKRGATSAPTT